ncbi:RAD51-associated protein 1 isoform X1 [Acipenser oxyrinchus oxyrinchus]|uniref:RAD51-associated protein 1 isoform X1 n=1 Tax=Acipenser oxyrinchus oxyrinchus TaxID=40147 RepID=A0AAD8G552_ACIOX|nr:RAD51-associated protein 1 isoform X1 [Acipenser oxyrinchus oxyrinchus]
MAKPTRNKKPVDYSYVRDFEDEDEDFACVKAPPSKKPRVAPKEPERQKKLKTTNKPPVQECGGSLGKPCEERLLVDDRLYQRDLEAALALSMLQTNEENFAVSLPKERDNDVHADSEVAKMDGAPLLSNCSVNINLLGLDKITDDNDTSGRNRQRQAASKAAIQQRKMLLDNEGDGDGDQDEEYEPGTPDVGSESDPDFSDEEEDVEEFKVKKGAKVKEAKIKAQSSKKEKKPLKSRLSATDVGSESDPDFSDEEEDVEEFTVKKGAKVKENKKEAKLKAQSSKKEKKPLKSRLSATVTPAAASPAPATSHPILMKPSNATLTASKPLQVQSPSGARKPKWTPPAQIGRSPNTSENLAVKSPSQGLRLGLSRFARVKPLHPGAASD